MASILVIEDDLLLSRQVELSLIQAGHKVLVATDGDGGIALARKHLPDLVLCDVSMPNTDGYAVIEALQCDSTTLAIPVVMMTALVSDEGRRRGMELGADDYLFKPFTIDQLQSAIQTRLHKHQLMKQRAEHQMSELRDSITLAIPHELRTPLFGILGAAEVISEEAGKFSPVVAEMTRDIIVSGQRMLRLVENFTIYAQIELMASDPQRIAKARRDNANTSFDALKAMAIELAHTSGRSADLHLNLTEDVVAMPEDLLSKICLELLDNAFKFSQPGAAVMVSSRLNAPFCELIVEDHGRGMSPQEVAAVGALMQFQRRLHEQQGTGMGLVVARRLAELYGGSISVQSRPTQGTTVTVQLPLAQG